MVFILIFFFKPLLILYVRLLPGQTVGGGKGETWEPARMRHVRDGYPCWTYNLPLIAALYALLLLSVFVFCIALSLSFDLFCEVFWSFVRGSCWT